VARSARTLFSISSIAKLLLATRSKGNILLPASILLLASLPGWSMNQGLVLACLQIDDTWGESGWSNTDERLPT